VGFRIEILRWFIKSKVIIQIVINEQERTEFQNKVEGIQKSFFKKLDELHSSAENKLTKTEKKLATLLKLQLTSKEIGSILNVFEISIEICRSRLRKKLNIDGNMFLIDYFNNI
jgi:DNA-binding NarL/FixJ family response regulator